MSSNDMTIPGYMDVAGGLKLDIKGGDDQWALC